jgi:sugar lactone lactonase YvrE
VRRTSPKRPAVRPALEPLEDRFCPSGSYLLVSSWNNDSVLRYDENTGAFVDTFVPRQSGGLREPFGVLFGPDHNLYVSSGRDSNKGDGQKAVLQYSGTTGAFRSDFADQNQLSSPRGIIFGPDGNLYVADAENGLGTVARFNGTTGAFMDDFVPTGSGGLSLPSALVFGPDGTKDGKLDLYVGVDHLNEILRYDGTTGAFLGTFVAPGSGGLNTPRMMAFGPDGDLYVANANFNTGSPFAPGSVLRYGGPSGPNPGALLGTFVPAGSGGLANPEGLLFGPDGKNDGKLDLYVASSVVYFTGSSSDILAAQPGTSEVLRYDGKTGAFLNSFVTPDSGGLQFPNGMAFTETDPTTLNYDGATTSPAAGTLLAQPASGTPLAPVLASSPSDSTSFGPTTVSVALPVPQPPAAPAGVTSPTLPFAPAPLPVLPLTSNLPPAGADTDSPGPAQASTAAADQVFASLGASQPFPLLGDDLALAGWSSDVLTPANPWG